MATITVYPATYVAGSTYSASNTSNPIGQGTSNTTYAQFGLVTGSSAETYLYYTFDLSEIPEGSTINSVTCSAKVYISSTSSSYVSTRQIRLYSGTTAKGSAATVSTSTTALSITAGDWTYDELQNARVRLYAKRGTSNTTRSYYFRFYGAELTVDYEEPEDDDPEVYDFGDSDHADFSYSGKSQRIYLGAGQYKLECWGAQGGNYDTYVGGYGGYSVGTLTLTETTKMYLLVGGQPASSSSSRAVTSGGYNGGGNGQNRYYSNVYTYGQGGGGGTDIRLLQNSLYARVIVAGGGGGSASHEDDTGTSKSGGGLQGGSGGASSSASYVAGQTAGTTSGYYLAGTFGQGASAYTSRTNYQNGSGGGGGGWYGGYAYNYSNDSDATLNSYNGGGSGYVYTSSTASDYPNGCLLTSVYYLTDAETIGGGSSFASTSGGTETGHEGNGFIRITKLSGGDDTGTGLYIKIGGTFKEVVNVYRKVNGSWQETTADTLDAAANYVLRE